MHATHAEGGVMRDTRDLIWLMRVCGRCWVLASTYANQYKSRDALSGSKVWLQAYL